MWFLCSLYVGIVYLWPFSGTQPFSESCHKCGMYWRCMSGPVFESRTASGKHSVVRPAMSHDTFTWSHDTSAWSRDTSTWSHDIPMSSHDALKKVQISAFLWLPLFSQISYSPACLGGNSASDTSAVVRLSNRSACFPLSTTSRLAWQLSSLSTTGREPPSSVKWEAAS